MIWNHRILKTLLLLASLFLGEVQYSSASHIVGGEVTYTCLGGNMYRIRLSIYRDCIGGIPNAISEDNPARIAIYTTAGMRVLFDSISGTTQTGEIVPPNFKNDCVNNPPKTCLNKMVFERDYFLDNSSTGFKIVYQRCCRNGSILNVVNPSSTGATYSCVIPQRPAAFCNNSAVFRNFPPQIICVNNPLVYDHAAFDPDGDSLSYEFCQAFDGASDGQARPFGEFLAEPLTYRTPYSFLRPMAGNPRVQIDPKTGLITGSPNLQGRFVVSVCCHEWRNGIRINTTTREFQFVVTNCSKAVVADIPQYSSEFNTYIVNCRDTKVDFVNTSKGGTTYFWDFGVDEFSDDTSIQFQPTYTYPDSGKFVVTLIVNKGTTCSDSITRFVKVYPKLKVDFISKDFICPGDTMTFEDISTSSYFIDKRTWNFDDFSPIDTGKEVRHVFPYGGLYNVGLIVENLQGCKDTVFRKILVDPFKPNIGKDTTIVKGEKIFFPLSGGSNTAWSPGTYLSDSNYNNPVGTFVDTGTFLYTVVARSEQTGCLGRDSIIIRVLNNGYLAVPNAFTPNGDGKNDRFRPLLVGYQNVRFFRIYNRYGELVFDTNNIEDSWDGTFNGQPVELGTYFWLIGVTDRFGKESQEKGDVIVIR